MMFIPARRGACTGRQCLVARIVAVVAAAWLVVGALLILFGRDAAAQGGPRSVAILILRGADTLVVERIQRDGRGVTAVIASPGAPKVSARFTLGEGHLVSALTFSVHGVNAADDAAPLQTGTLTVRPDSVLLDITAGGQTRSLRRPAQPGTFPVMNNDFVVAEQSVRRARALGVTKLEMPLFAMSNGQTLAGTLELFHKDSARFGLMGNVTTIAVDAAGNVTGGHIAAQGLRIVVLEGAAAAAVSFGRPDYSAPAGAPYTAEEVSVRTPAGHVLGGTLTLPSGASASARVPAVVTITGSGLQDRDELLPFAGGVRMFRQVADTLGRRGIAVLRLDDRAIGASGGDPNGTSADFADDIRAGVAYLRTRAEVDPARIALVGHSEGGIIAPMIAADDPRLAAIVLMAGTAYTGRRIIDYQLDNVVRGDPVIAAAAKDSVIRALKAGFDSTDARKPWMRYFLAYDPLPTIKRVKQPVLVLQGETDQQVRPEEARALHAALREAGNTRVTLKMLPARNHLFLADSVGHPSGYAALSNGKVDGEVLGTLADWLVSTLGAKP